MRPLHIQSLITDNTTTAAPEPDDASEPGSAAKRGEAGTPGKAPKRGKASSLPWWFWLIFLGTGLIFMSAAVAWFLHHYQFVASASRTQGTVIRYEEDWDLQDDVYMYAPVISYVVADREYTIVSAAKSTRQPYKIGDSIPVLYDPQNPQHGKVASFSALWLGPLVMGVLGLLFALLGGTGHVKRLFLD